MAQGKEKAKVDLKNYFPRILPLVVLAVIVYLVAKNIDKVGSVLLALIGLGMVVLVHELGHYIFAKLAGINVRSFSIGMGPVLLGVRKSEKGFRFRILPSFFPDEKDEDGDGDGLLSFNIGRSDKAGETEYRINLIPFGGFVGMLGQEDVGAAKKSNDPRSFMNKSIGARMKVIAAGVSFNVLCAALIFIVVFLIGIDFRAPVVGGLRPDSPAQIAGLRAGDEIIEINGRSDIDFSDISSAAMLSNRGEKIHLTARRLDGTIKEFSIKADVPTDKDTSLRILGILPADSLTIAEVEDPNVLYENTGLLPGDVITAVDGKKVRHSWEFEELIASTLAESVTVTANRICHNSADLQQIQSKPLSLEMLAYDDNFKTGYKLNHICSIVPRLKIIGLSVPKPSITDGLLALWKKLITKPHSPEKLEPALKVGDIITAVAEIQNPTFKELRKTTVEYEKKKLPIKVLRRQSNGDYHTVTVNVEPKKSIGSERVVVGIFVASDAKHPVVAGTIQTEAGLPALKIPKGAVITAVAGEDVSNFYDIIDVIDKNKGREISISYQLDDKTTGQVSLEVPLEGQFITTKTVLASFVPFKALNQTYKAAGPVDAIVMGCRRTIRWIGSSYRTLRGLLAGTVSPKNLMGPIGIIGLGSQVVAHKPFTQSLYLFALINALIAVFNFLPLPILDGGHMVLLIIEKIKGSPLSYRTQAVINYIGLVFIGALALYITRNDIIRILFQ